MKFSILTPTRNRPDQVREAVASVIAQTYTDWELILYDVSDEPIEWPSDPRIDYHCGEAHGPAADFQFCLDHATGDIIHPLSDDDLLPPHALATALERIGDREWLIARTVINQAGMPVAFRGGHPVTLEQTRAGQYMLGGAVYWRKSLSDRVGGFDSAYDGAADFDLYLRFADAAEPAFAKDILYLYADHADTDSRAQHARQADASMRIAARG